MKVIERKDPAKEFNREVTCPKCKSRLAIEASDLLCRDHGYDQRDQVQCESFFVKCAVCEGEIPIWRDVPERGDIPELVRKAARRVR